MNEQTNNINAAFMEVTSKKMELVDKKMLAIEEKIKNTPDNAGLIGDLTTKVDELHDAFSSSFSIDKLDELTKRLEESIHFLKLPLQNKVVHQQHVPKIIWIAAGLFIVLALVCSGWYNTYNKLDASIANDSKYRYLKLDTANRKLQLYMFMLDSLYAANINFRSKVIYSEEQNLKNLDLLQKAYKLKCQAKNWRRWSTENNKAID
ncbi:MAG: hypothetical protein ABJB86_11400 [Bacteroidota bacterium]